MEAPRSVRICSRPFFGSRDVELFPELGISLRVLHPGGPNCRYHAESTQEDFLVLSGECILLVDVPGAAGRAWDFVHCPGGTRSTSSSVPARSPCVILMVGASRPDDEIVYPRLRARPEARSRRPEEAHDPADAYADLQPAAARPTGRPGPAVAAAYDLTTTVSVSVFGAPSVVRFALLRRLDVRRGQTVDARVGRRSSRSCRVQCAGRRARGAALFVCLKSKSIGQSDADDSRVPGLTASFADGPRSSGGQAASRSSSRRGSARDDVRDHEPDRRTPASASPPGAASEQRDATAAGRRVAYASSGALRQRRARRSGRGRRAATSSSGRGSPSAPARAAPGRASRR